MSSKKILWVAYAIIMIISLDLIVARFLMDKSPVLATIIIIMMSIALLAAVPSPGTKRAYKVMFLASLLVSTGFTISLYNGLFESMILLDDSWIDISHSAVIFHLKNNGLTDWTIKEVNIANVTLTLNYPSSSVEENLQAEDTAYLIIYYCDNVFQWISSAYATKINWDPAQPFSPWFPMDWPCVTKGEVTPLTFQNGSSYPAVFKTNGILKHSFAVEAKLILDEELNVSARRWLSENSKEVWVRFNNTGKYYSYIYTIQVANVTFYFKPPIRVSPSSSLEEMRLIFPRGEGLVGWGVNYYGNIYAVPTPDFSMLQIGTTYNILVKTMTNKTYIIYVII